MVLVVVVGTLRCLSVLGLLTVIVPCGVVPVRTTLIIGVVVTWRTRLLILLTSLFMLERGVHGFNVGAEGRHVTQKLRSQDGVGSDAVFLRNWETLEDMTNLRVHVEIVRHKQ